MEKQEELFGVDEKRNGKCGVGKKIEKGVDERFESVERGMENEVGRK
ncbi:hypothetical protein [Bacillus subtilis]|nr:hypothetical protein [Bacillus subtilis]